MPNLNLDDLERLVNEDIDLDGEKLETIGTQVILSDGFKYAHAFAKNDDFWLASCRARLIAATINAAPELIAENRALRERVQELEFQLGEVEFDNSGLCREIDGLKRQRDWLVNYYAKVEAPVPCPYLEGSFDQTKPCPFWCSDSGEMPEDDTVEEWRKLLLAPVEYGDEYLDCGTSLNVCLRYAAEQAAKEAGE